MDFPEAGEAVDQVLIALDEAIERVRSLSQDLNPSPAAHLVCRQRCRNWSKDMLVYFPGRIRLTYTAAAQVPPDSAVAIYDAVAATLNRAVHGSRRPRASALP